MSASIAILGGRGMLGSDLAACLRGQGQAVQVWDLPEWDITRPECLERALQGAAAVVNCAAFTDVDRAEDEPDTARAINATAVGHLGRLARRRGVFVVHISTDFVFDGQADRPYLETDAPAPINVYGHTKWQGELALWEAAGDHAILRTEWSYGQHGDNFITRFLAAARQGGELKVVNDQFGAPTWTRDIAGAIACLLRGRHQGLYHFANAGFASRFEVASFIAERLKLSARVAPCASGEYPVKARRPANSRLDTTRIQALLERPIRPWQEAMDEFLAAR